MVRANSNVYAALEAVIKAGAERSEQGLHVIGIAVTNQVKINITKTYPPASRPGTPPALRTGGLRKSYRYEVTPSRAGRVAKVAIFSDPRTVQPVPPHRQVVYACVFDAHTLVPTAAGIRTIGQVREGDLVLTATGEWREVLKATRFPVSEKPDLVTLTAPWRAGKSHKITVTADHEIAIQREGRVLWVPAGSIQPDDQVFRRRKQAHNRKDSSEPLFCERCGVPLSNPRNNRSRRYCFPCAKVATADWHRGQTRDVLARSRMAAAALGRPVNHLAAKARHRGTSVENLVANWLDGRGVDYERSVVFGRRYVDFWIPETVEIYEADGAYWHRDQARDIQRDQALLDAIPGARITHLHFYDPRWTPILDPNPLPNVRYEIVNPSAESFVEPDTFEAVPVEVAHWTWQPKPGARITPMLYDLTVEGVHSFVAAGLLVSNSYLEFGTSRMAARPHLRPAVEQIRPLIPGMIRQAWAAGVREEASKRRRGGR